MDARRLDALVAEHVMGWKREARWANGMEPIPPPLSITWAGVGAVIEAMRAKDWLLECGHLPHEIGCYAVFRLLTIDPIHEEWAAVAECERADTLPEAVALAALRALGVRVPDAALKGGDVE